MDRIFKLVVGLIVIVTFLNGIAIACYGLYKCGHVYYSYFNGGEHQAPVVGLVGVIDYFLIAFVFLILSIGFARLFLNDSQFFNGISLDWFEVRDLNDLKLILWHTILLAMVVAFGASIVSMDTIENWKVIIMPASILLLAVAARMIKH